MDRISATVARSAAMAGAMAVVLSVAATGQASAQAARACVAQGAPLAEELGRQYGEVLTAAGVDANGNLIQVYSSDDKGTWTIAMTLPGGTTCVLSTGEGWVRERAVEIRQPGNPA